MGGTSKVRHTRVATKFLALAMELLAIEGGSDSALDAPGAARRGATGGGGGLF